MYPLYPQAKFSEYMEGVKFRKTFSNFYMYFISAVKLVAVPAVGVGIMFLLKLLFSVNADMIIGFFIAL